MKNDFDLLAIEGEEDPKSSIVLKPMAKGVGGALKLLGIEPEPKTVLPKKQANLQSKKLDTNEIPNDNNGLIAILDERINNKPSPKRTAKSPKISKADIKSICEETKKVKTEDRRVAKEIKNSSNAFKIGLPCTPSVKYVHQKNGEARWRTIF